MRGGAWGDSQEKGKYLVYTCTVACQLKNVVTAKLENLSHLK